MVKSLFRTVVLGNLVLVAVVAGCTVSATQPPDAPTAEQEAVSTPATRATADPVQPSAIRSTTVRPTVQSDIEQGQPTPGNTRVPGVSTAVISGPLPTSTPYPQAATAVSGEPTPEPGNQNSQVDSMFGPIACWSVEEPIVLTHSIYDPELFDELVPMGRMWDSHVTPTDHLYVFLNQQRERDLVRTPAAGRLVSVGSFPREQSPFWDESIKEPDLRIVIAHSCTLFSVFIHVGELVPEIAAVVGDLETGGRWYPNWDEVVELGAGDPFAILGGSSFDYSLHDETITLAGFQVPEHYEGEPWKVHTVDPFDYMSAELTAALLPKNVRQVEPYGGKIDYDVPGTLAGNWFMDGTVDYGGAGLPTENYWNGHLSISYDHVDPSEIRISIGRDVGLTEDDCRTCGGVYAVKSNAPDPAAVTVADGLIKYEMTGRKDTQSGSRESSVSDGNVLGTFLAQVVDDATIRVEFVIGASANSVSGFSENAVLYRR